MAFLTERGHALDCSTCGAHASVDPGHRLDPWVVAAFYAAHATHEMTEHEEDEPCPTASPG